MGQVAQQLGRTLGPGAPYVGPILVPHHRSTAHGALVGQLIRYSALRTFGGDHRHNLRDDFPRLLYHYGVPNADILLGNEILVVKGGVGHRGASQTHRVHHSLGGEHSSAAYLHHNVPHHALLLFRRVLEGGSPTGEFCRLP